MSRSRLLAALALAVALPLTACSSDGGDDAAAAGTAAATTAAGGGAEAAGVVLVNPADAQAVLVGQPEAVTLDIRTPEEFVGGHLADAQLIDFYGADFAQRIGELPKDATYVLYCRSGNRSAEAAALMRSQGFQSVYEVDGGILAWAQAGLPIER
jgi:phage shock protein E